MKNIRVFLWLIVMWSARAFAGTISVQPVTLTTGLGSAVSVNVDVADVQNLYAFQFDVTFDPSILSAISTTEGSLFSNVGVFFSPGVIDNSGGSISFIADSLSGPGPGLSADGTLAQITFNSVGTGSSNVVLSNIVLLDSGLNDITVSASDATVTVKGNSVSPEPSTGALLSAAVAMAAIVGAAFRPRKALLN